MTYSDRKTFRGMGSGGGGLARPTFELGVNDGRITLIALYGSGPYAVVDLNDVEFRERIDIYARAHDLFKGGGSSQGRDEAVRRLIEIGLRNCDVAAYIDSNIVQQKQTGYL